jgi:hypothetical protein
MYPLRTKSRLKGLVELRLEVPSTSSSSSDALMLLIAQK